MSVERSRVVSALLPRAACTRGHLASSMRPARPARPGVEAGMSRLRLEERPAPAPAPAQSLAMQDEEYMCEYREDIWKHLLEAETEKPKIKLQSPQLQFRGALVKQLREATGRLRLNSATLHVAVQLLDMFMDAHHVEVDRLTDLAFACLSLAAKSEEKFSRAPCLKTLSKICDVHLSARTFRQLEWMVGQHVRWRLLLPTAVTFATLLAHNIVTEQDLISKNPQFVSKFKKEGYKQLDSYLDLTLYNVRLKVTSAAEVGCACVACARAHLGLDAWPGWLAGAAGQSAAKVAPIAATLQRMMQVLKAREAIENTEADQGYGSARTSPSLTPSASPLTTDSAGSTPLHHPKPTVETTVLLRQDVPRYIRESSANLANSINYSLNKNVSTSNISTHKSFTNVPEGVLTSDTNVPEGAVSTHKSYTNVPEGVLTSDTNVPEGDLSTRKSYTNVPERNLCLSTDQYRFSHSQRLVEASMEVLEPRGLKRTAIMSADVGRKRNRV